MKKIPSRWQKTGSVQRAFCDLKAFFSEEVNDITTSTKLVQYAGPNSNTNSHNYTKPVLKVSIVQELSDFDNSIPISSPRQSSDLIREMIGDSDLEHLIVVFLNRRNTVIAIQTVHIGTESESLVSPRSILKRALLTNADAIIIGHNHPSGSLSFSTNDLTLSDKLKAACELIGITLFDFLIVIRPVTQAWPILSNSDLLFFLAHFVCLCFTLTGSSGTLYYFNSCFLT